MPNFRTSKYMTDGTAIDDPNSTYGLTNTQTLSLQTLASGSGVINTYDGSGRLSTVTKIGGRSYTYTYTSAVSTIITASDGAILAITLNGSGKVVSAINV